MNPVMLMQLLAGHGSLAGLDEGVHTLDHHQDADGAEKQHIGERDHQVDLPDGFEQGEDPRPQDGAENTADKQHDAHLEIHISPPPVGQNAGHAGGRDLVGNGGDGHGGRNADKDQQRRHQKPAANAKHAG